MFISWMTTAGSAGPGESQGLGTPSGSLAQWQELQCWSRHPRLPRRVGREPRQKQLDTGDTHRRSAEPVTAPRLSQHVLLCLQNISFFSPQWQFLSRQVYSVWD